MAALTEQEKREILHSFTKEESRTKKVIADTKPEILATIEGLDAYLELNKAAILAAAQPTDLTNRQLLILFKKIVEAK